MGWEVVCLADEAHSAVFLRRALAEAARYGDDPWVFLRELGQNARDAGARRIRVSLQVEPDRARLIFADDGGGMGLEHARAYLFRLYASSKEQDLSAAGRFGVGFWSVLRFGPRRIEVHSRTADAAWAVGLRGDLTGWQRLECGCRRPGTVVVLERTIDPGAGEALRDQVHRNLVRYLAHLRTAGRRPRPLAVRFDGQRIDRPFQLDSAGALRFRQGQVEGVVGFGSRPAYRLYARGLPVLEGAYLEELESGLRRPDRQAEREGVAPVYRINGNQLEVVLSRQTVVRDRALRELLRVARSRFEELVARTIDGAVASTWWRRSLRRLGAVGHGLQRLPRWLRLAMAAMSLLLAGGAAGLLMAAGQQDASREEAAAVAEAPRAAAPAGPVATAAPRAVAGAGPARPARPPVPRAAIDRPGGWRRVRTSTVLEEDQPDRWDIQYRPPGPLLFRRRLLERYLPGLGWQASEEQGPWRALAGKANRSGVESVTVELGVAGEGWYLLPVPSGYAVQDSGAVLGDRRLLDGVQGRGRRLALQINPAGLLRVELPAGTSDRLSYRLLPDRKLTSRLRRRLLRPIDARLPAELEQELEKWLAPRRGLSAEQRVDRALAWVQRRMVYDRSPAVGVAYAQRLRPEGSWVTGVLDIGAGDCDVINGLLVVLLRRLQVPARLVAGLVGSGGRVLDGWHAWVELERGGRLATLDATLGARRRGAEVVDVAGRSGGSGESGVSGGSIGPGGGLRGGSPAVAKASASAKAAADEMAGSAAGGGGQLVGAVGWSLLAAALGLVMLGAVLAVRRRSQPAAAAPVGERRELLAGMAADALRRPRAWQAVRNIWHRAFLPCLGGRTISLARMLRLARADRALLGSADNELAHWGARQGLAVLDAGDAQFGPVFASTAGLRNLDELARWRPLARAPVGMGLLLTRIDRLLARAGLRLVCRAVAADGSDRALWDVDLAPLRPPADSLWPRRFVALDPRHGWWRALAERARQAPGLAVALAVDRLAAESRLVAPRAERLRRLAAAQALEEAG